jgi:hypothetical protein
MSIPNHLTLECETLATVLAVGGPDGPLRTAGGPTPEEAAEKVMRDVPRMRVEELISDRDNPRPTSAGELDEDG